LHPLVLNSIFAVCKTILHKYRICYQSDRIYPRANICLLYWRDADDELLQRDRAKNEIELARILQNCRPLCESMVSGGE